MRTIKLRQMLVAFILLISLLLQGCTNSSNSLIPSVEEQVADTQQAIIEVASTSLVVQQLRVEEDCLVTFNQQDEHSRPGVVIKSTDKFGETYNKVSDYVGEHEKLVQVVSLDNGREESFAELKSLKIGQEGCVFVGNKGELLEDIRNSIKKEDEDQEEKEKETESNVLKHSKQAYYQGRLYLQGIVPGIDFQRGYDLLEQAGKAGVAKACLLLGQINEYGLGKKINLEEAIYWYTLAAEAESKKPKNKPRHTQASALYHLGWLHRLGKGTTKSEGQGLLLLKQASIAGKRESTTLGNFEILPIELLYQIFADISFPQVLNVRAINHFFNKLITGYAQVNLINLANKPSSCFYSTSWASNNTIDFYQDKFKELTPEKTSRFFFYRLMKDVKCLPPEFWPYLPSSHILNLDLYYLKIGDKEARNLALALANTNIQTLNLCSNDIGAAGAREIALALPNTNIQALYLTDNHIGDEGASSLALMLPSTKIHLLSLIPSSPM